MVWSGYWDKWPRSQNLAREPYRPESIENRRLRQVWDTCRERRHRSRNLTLELSRPKTIHLTSTIWPRLGRVRQPRSWNLAPELPRLEIIQNQQPGLVWAKCQKRQPRRRNLAQEPRPKSWKQRSGRIRAKCRARKP